MDCINEYLRALSELRKFLEDYGDRYCTPRLRDFAEEYITMHDQWDKSAYVAYFQKVIRGISGGMGSISDLTLSVAAGHSVAPSSVHEVNRQKDALIEALYLTAKKALAEKEK